MTGQSREDGEGDKLKTDPSARVQYEATDSASKEAESGKASFFDDLARREKALMTAREAGIRTGTHDIFGTPTIDGTSIKGDEAKASGNSKRESFPSVDQLLLAFNDESHGEKKAESTRPADGAGAVKKAYLPLSLNERDLADLNYLNKSPDFLAACRQQINDLGENPVSAVSNLLRGNRVLALGENHYTPNAMRDFGARVMADLKRSGATHLALEVPESLQTDLDNFAKDGHIDRSKLPALLQDDDYLALLESARIAGLKLVASDLDRKQGSVDSGSRDPHMGAVIKNLLEDPNAKVVFWAGSEHEEHAPGNGDSAVEFLQRDGIKVASVFGEIPNLPTTLSHLTPDLSEAVAVSMQKADKLAELPHSKLSDLGKYSKWDEVIVFPGVFPRTGKDK